MIDRHREQATDRSDHPKGTGIAAIGLAIVGEYPNTNRRTP